MLKHAPPAPSCLLILHPLFRPFCSEYLPLWEWAVSRRVFILACRDIELQCCVGLRETLFLQYHFTSEKSQSERCSNLPRLHIWSLIRGIRNRFLGPSLILKYPKCLPISCSFTLLDYTFCILTLFSHLTDEGTVGQRVKQQSHPASKRQREARVRHLVQQGHG